MSQREDDKALGRAEKQAISKKKQKLQTELLIACAATMTDVQTTQLNTSSLVPEEDESNISSVTNSKQRDLQEDKD